MWKFIKIFRNKDICEWLLDNKIDTDIFITQKVNDNEERVLLSDLLERFLKDQIEYHNSQNSCTDYLKTKL